MLNLQPVHKALEDLQNEFKANPTLYFTEHDIASRCYHLVQNALNYQTVGVEGHKYYLVHHEYPTPFRCDMSGSNFETKTEDERTSKDGKFQRGHYDLVVFNPEFLGKCDYELANGQNYKLLNEKLPDILAALKEPAILLGIEFMLNRSPFLSTDGVEKWVAKIKQDYNKLKTSVEWGGKPFMKEYLMLAFDGAEHGYREAIIKELSGLEGLVYCFQIRHKLQ